MIPFIMILTPRVIRDQGDTADRALIALCSINFLCRPKSHRLCRLVLSSVNQSGMVLSIFQETLKIIRFQDEICFPSGQKEGSRVNSSSTRSTCF